MRAGTLRKRITIQQPSDVADNQGGMTRIWTTFLTCWSAIDPLSGQERLQYAQLYPTVSIKVTIRYVSGLKAKMRLLFGTRIYEIQAILDPGMIHRELQLLCEEQGVT